MSLVGFLGRVTRYLAPFALFFFVVVVLIAVVLPSYQLARLRVEYPLFNSPMMWAEDFHNFDMVHLLLFGALGFIARVVLRDWPVGRLVAGLVLLSAATELVQFVVPGRHPRWNDFGIDLVAGVGGITMGAAILRPWLRRGGGIIAVR